MLRRCIRAWEQLGSQSLQWHVENTFKITNRSQMQVYVREFANVRPKPRRPKLIKLTPEVKRTLEGRDEEDEDDEERKKMSKNALKRRSDKALEMARLLATLTSGQLKRVIQWTSLPGEVYEATRIVQKMEATGVREGKRRQYNFLEGLIRHSRLDVLEYILQCVRCGETVSLQRVLEAGAPEKEKHVKSTTERWIQGLLNNDQSVSKEVYALPIEMFDREELRRLIRELRMKLAEKDKPEESEGIQKARRRRCAKARKHLFKFLASLARRDYNTKVVSTTVEPLHIENVEDLQAMVNKVKVGESLEEDSSFDDEESEDKSEECSESESEMLEYKQDTENLLESVSSDTDGEPEEPLVQLGWEGSDESDEEEESNIDISSPSHPR